jgi:hypothetical protein
MRKIIVHYHLFKNAGTSVDVLLKRNFGSRWGEYEGGGKKLPPDELGAYLTANPQLEALSSHNALLPLPQLPDTEIFPILFLRHPIDRIRSVYEFERTQNAMTEGARTAKRKTFADYVEWRRARWFDYSVQNFQTWRLAQGARPSMTLGTRNIWSHALKTLESLPFIGVVEQFELSIKGFETMLRPHFSGLTFEAVWANVSRARDSNLDERLERIEAELGRDRFVQLVRENELDMKIHELVRERLQDYALTTANYSDSKCT